MRIGNPIDVNRNHWFSMDSGLVDFDWFGWGDEDEDDDIDWFGWGDEDEDDDIDWFGWGDDEEEDVEY